MLGTINAQSLPSTNNAAIPNPLPPMVEDPASWANENDLTIILDLCNLCDEYMELAPPLVRVGSVAKALGLTAPLIRVTMGIGAA